MRVCSASRRLIIVGTGTLGKLTKDSQRNRRVLECNHTKPTKAVQDDCSTEAGDSKTAPTAMLCKRNVRISIGRSPRLAVRERKTITQRVKDFLARVSRCALASAENHLQRKSGIKKRNSIARAAVNGLADRWNRSRCRRDKRAWSESGAHETEQGRLKEKGQW
jgi:hypothetical protein